MHRAIVTVSYLQTLGIGIYWAAVDIATTGHFPFVDTSHCEGFLNGCYVLINVRYQWTFAP